MVNMSDSMNQVGYYIDEHAAQIQENLHATLTQHIAPYMQLTSEQQSTFLDSMITSVRNVFFQNSIDTFWDSIRTLTTMLSSWAVQEHQQVPQPSISGMVFDVCNLVRRSILNVLKPFILSDPAYGMHIFEHIDSIFSDTVRIEVNDLCNTHVRMVEQTHCNDDIRVQKDWYERAIKASQLDIWDWNLDTDEVYLAPHLKEMLGYTDEEIGNYIEEWVKLIHPDDYQLVKQRTREALKNQMPSYKLEHRILHKDGSIRWIAVKGTMLRDTNGRVTRMSGTIDDITERKQSEIELHRRDSILSAVATAAEQFLRVFSLRHNIEDLLFQLGTITEVSQVCVIENLFADTTNPILSLRFEWVAPSTQGKRLVLPTVSYLDAGLLRWKQTLSAGELIYGIVNDFPENEQHFLRQHNICSIVAVPIFTGSAWWGVIAFTDTHTERIWSSAEIDAITIAAGMIGAAIHRDHVQKVIDRNESELRKFFRAVEQSPNAIFITDTRGFIEYVNPRFTKNTGYSFSEAVGSTPRILKSGETPPEEYINLWQTITSGQEWRGVLRNQSKDGKVFWTSVSISPIINANGLTTHYVAVEENVTERMQAEEALRESEQKFRSIIEQSDDAIILDDEQGMIIEWNKGAEKLSGLKRSEVLGRPSWDVLFTLLPTERKLHRVWRNRERSIKQFHQTGRASWLNHMLEFELQHISGTRQYVQQLAFPIATSKGFMLCSIIRDVTEQKKYQEELQKSREVAEAASRAKTEFLASMSHEIRNPLNAIIGMNNLLLHSPLTSKQQDLVETAVSSGENLLTIINDVLDFSKIEAGKLELKHERFHLRECIEESLDLLAARAAEKQLDLAYFIDDATPPVVIGDSLRLRQILINLLSNAIKFTNVGEVVVSVEKLSADTNVVFSGEYKTNGDKGTFEQKEDSVTIHINVRDTGIGITPEHQNNLFESYSGTSDVRKYGGTGLGLAISKRLSMLMGGTMWVESVIGQGSTFHVTIQVQEERLIDRMELEPFKYEHAILKGKRVLIVDNTPCSHQVITHFIEQVGMHPWFTFDRDEALQWTHHGEHFDLILINLLRNHTEGLDLAEKIHALPAYSRVPIVLFVSFRTWHEVSLHMGNTITTSLFLPVKPMQMYETILGIFTKQPVKSRKPITRTTLDAHMGSRHPLRLLLAEDTPANQKMFLYSLESLGYNADVANNGLAVLDMIQQQLYDVILMDVQMPEMNGIEATQYIRANIPKEYQPWIIALTAHAMEGDRERCLDAGMNDYVRKPVVHVEDLAEALVKAPALDRAIHESFVASRHEQPKRVSEDKPSDGYTTGLPMHRVNRDTVEFPTKHVDDGAISDLHTSVHISNNNVQPMIDPVQKPAECSPEPVAEPTKRDDTVEHISPSANSHEKPGYIPPHINITTNNTSSPLDSTMSEYFFSIIRQRGKNVMHEFVEMFIHNMSERLTMVQKAESEQQPDDLKMAAHSLKSLSAQVGAQNLSAISLKLELLGMEHTMDGSSDLVRQAVSEYERVKVALREKILRE